METINLAERRKAKEKKKKPQPDKVALKAKSAFNDVLMQAQSLENDDLRDYVMLVFADLTIFVLNAEFFEDAPKALKRGIDILERDYGPAAQQEPE
jgi:hypothetical protein